MATPRCSIIIRSYNEEKHILRLLEGITQQTVKDVEIILVDSGSTDGTVETAARYLVKVVNISPQEFTFGRSINRGIQQATADLIVLASAHVYPVYPDWLEKLLAPFEDPLVALAYGKQRGGKTTKFSEQQIFESWYPDGTPTDPGNPFCNNANAAVRRELTLLHPYNETLSGLEDLDWARWAMDQGYKIQYVPEAEIVHVHHETPKGVYNRYKREAIAFKQLYIHERFGFLDFVRLSARNIARDMNNASKQGVLGRNFFSIIWFRICQFWGTYQGYRHHGPLTWQLRQKFYYPNGVTDPASHPEREVEPIQYRSIK